MIERIKKHGLCLGCGLCSSLLGSDKCEMGLNDEGFYVPNQKHSLTSKENALIKKICPAIHVVSKSHKGVWGSMKAICEAWSVDREIRYKAASGGVVTSLAIFLLESHTVDAILQVGVAENSYLYNELKVSRSREQVLKCAQSRYAPALVFSRIKEIFDTSKEIYAFVGKPCDIAGMQNFCREFPEYKKRVKCYISIFCAGMPNYNATVKTWRMSGHTDAPVSLKYRGDGWPGNFKAVFKDGSFFQMTYNESWGKILGRNLGYRCKICPDGIGMLADVAVGDCWNTVNGYPDFTEADGKCFCMIRTDAGAELMKRAEESGYVEMKSMNLNEIENMQAYQFQRRKMEGWRLLPIQLYTGFILKFKGLSILRLSLSANLFEGVKNMKGSFLRLLKH